jgi:hypothetical protein
MSFQVFYPHWYCALCICLQHRGSRTPVHQSFIDWFSSAKAVYRRDPWGPMLVGRSSDTYQLPHPFRQPLHFIVITVTTVALPVSMQFLRDDPYVEPS